MFVGIGYDVHRFTEGRKLILGGVEIPYGKGLEAHSDGDVLLHAIMDALLGAAAEGDIGLHFPDTDDRYLGADSTVLLAEVGKILEEKGYRIENIDSTVLCQRPKLRSYIPGMRCRVAGILGLEEDQVSIKATTEEGLGFTGDGSGIAAHAVVLISRNEP